MLMGGAGETAWLDLRLDRAGIDDEELDRLTRSLRRTIEEADLEGARVEHLAGHLPAGARGDPVTLGAFTVAVAPVVVEQLIQVVREWCSRAGTKPVKVAVRVGDREVSAEYDAARMTTAEVETVARTLRSTLAG
jgi:hypothetical protein